MENNKNLKSFSQYEKLWEASVSKEQMELDQIKSWLSDTTEAYDDYDWDGETLTVFKGDEQPEVYSRKDLMEVGALGPVEEAEVAYHKDSPKADDSAIEALELKMKEYWGLSSDIDAITKEMNALLDKKLGELPGRLKEVTTKIESDIQILNIQKIKTDKVVASFRRSYQQPSPSYKPMWETALTKVNDNTRKVLEALVSEFTKETTVKSRFEIKRESLQVNEGILDSIKGLFSKGANFILGLFGRGLTKAKMELPGMQESTEDLDNINQQIAEYEDREANREIPKWQADQY